MLTVGAGQSGLRRVGARLAALTLALLSLTGCGNSGSTAPPTTRRTGTTEASTPSTAPSTSTTSCSNPEILSGWTLARRVAQLVVVPVPETDVSSIAPTVQLGIGGIILFGSDAPADLKSVLTSVEGDAPGGVAPFVMTDEEGGEVQRMANLVGSLPWPATMAQTMTVAQVRQLAQETGVRMLANGVTMDLAPVLDLASGPGPDALHTDGPRSFSPVASIATEYGLAFAQGLQAGGVIPVVKHFPGEGDASANTDSAPATTPPLASLEKADLLPFEAAIKAGLPAVMVGNASIPGLSTVPASLSPAVVTGLLRNQLGFRGLVITDSLSAGAVAARGLDVPSATVEALQAGADMVLFNSAEPNVTSQAVIAKVVSAVDAGTLSTSQIDGAVDQVLTLKKVDLCR